ncbi:hypothetical protein D0772_02275, partial [Campylobacter lari]|nr:hypothetical protein [Campylobacter lari]
MCKYKKEYEYIVCENIKLIFLLGKKEKNDYIVKWKIDNQQYYQFSDKDLFDILQYEIKSKEEALKFINFFYNYEKINFNEECIELTIDNIQEILDYVSELPLNNKLKLCLACMFFRCDIDNINYPCTIYNGCIRHFMQIVMLFGYKFDIIEFKCEKLSINNEDNISNIIS